MSSEAAIVFGMRDFTEFLFNENPQSQPGAAAEVPRCLFEGDSLLVITIQAVREKDLWLGACELS